MLLLLAASTLGHAELEESDPADGETIATPYTLIATFSEPLVSDRSGIEIYELGDGAELARGRISEGDSTVIQVDLELSNGEYVAHWTRSLRTAA